MFCVVYSISLERLNICIFILFNVKVMWICVFKKYYIGCCMYSHHVAP